MVDNENFKLPNVVFLDTNILEGLSVGKSDESYLKLKNLCDELGTKIVISEVVWYEWASHHIERTKKWIGQVKTGITEVNKLLSIEIPMVGMPEDYIKMLIRTLKNRLENSGIKVAPTPKNISVGDLALKASLKIKPFEKKGEKGFRDTVILKTIISYSKKHKFGKVFFITNDLIFEDEEVKKDIFNNGIDMSIYQNVPDAIKAINDTLDKKVKQAIDKRNEKRLSFVKLHESEVFDFLMKNAEISEDFLTKNGFLSAKTELYGRIEKVTSFKPVSITDVSEGYVSFKKEYIEEKEVEPVSISTSIDIEVIYSPMLLFNNPKLKVDSLNNFREEIDKVNRNYYDNPIKTTIQKQISIEARLIKNKKGEYQRLVLNSVLSF